MQARKVMHAVWGMGQMQFTKFVVIVDEDVDVHDHAEVAWRVFNNVDPRRDTLLTEGPLDALDHSSPTANWGAKLGIDATRKWPEEGHTREWPPDIVMDPDVVARVDAMWDLWVWGFFRPGAEAGPIQAPGRSGRAGRRSSRCPFLGAGVGAAARRSGVLQFTVLFFRLVKFEHTVFALPFAYAGAFLAQLRIPGLDPHVLDHRGHGGGAQPGTWR